MMPGAALPSVFPATLRAKIDTALVIAAPTSTGGTYLAISADRVDAPDAAIDIHPFGLIVHSTGPSASGVFINHGRWEERTRRPPREFWDEVSRSGIGRYYLTRPLHDAREGTLDQLPKGDEGAFKAVVRHIRAGVDGQQ